MKTNSNRQARRFLFSCGGGYGHFHPLVPLAQALKEAGHAVAFAVGPSLQPRVEKEGFEALLINSKLKDDPEYQQFKAQLAEMPTTFESELLVYNRLFCGISPRVRMPHMMEVAHKWQPDMLIRDAAVYSAVIVAERLGLPHATVAFTSALKGMAVFERDAASQLDPIREQWGLPPDPDLAALYRYLCLSYTPPSFGLQDVGMQGASNHVPATTHFVHPEFYDQSGQEGLPGWVAQLPPRPTVYVTLGTEVNNEPEFYPSVLQTIIARLRDAPINLIVTLGRDKDPVDFGPQPANVHIERYIPQSLLLKHIDLMVMHGGSNSLLAALEVGLPLVVVPLIADQFFNAHITEKLQLGEVVRFEQLTPENIRVAVDEVLANPVYRQTAGRLQAEMQALPGMAYAVELVEQVASSHEPLLNKALE
ncbi:MAG TPA: glycosyltransferase [Chloroflexia bacterium]|nr:glycosyltransferase [Chloroflexia bacterium]